MVRTKRRKIPLRKIVFKFYQYGDWATLMDKAIHVVSELLHVEALFEDGLSFSSSQRSDISGESVEGVRFKDIHYSHPERWIEIVLYVTDEEYKRIRLRCECLAHLGLKYDMRGAIGCLFTGKQDPEKYFCSEVVYDAVLCEWLPPILNVKMHPDKLYVIAAKLAEKLKGRFNG